MYHRTSSRQVHYEANFVSPYLIVCSTDSVFITALGMSTTGNTRFRRVHHTRLGFSTYIGRVSPAGSFSGISTLPDQSHVDLVICLCRCCGICSLQSPEPAAFCSTFSTSRASETLQYRCHKMHPSQQRNGTMVEDVCGGCEMRICKGHLG